MAWHGVTHHAGQGHGLGGLVGGIAEHEALVTSANVLGPALAAVCVLANAAGNVGRLLLDGDEHVARLVVEALEVRVVANLLDAAADDLLVVNVGLARNLAEHHDHARLGRTLAGDAAVGVLQQAGIEHGIGDLVADLVCAHAQRGRV